MAPILIIAAVILIIISVLIIAFARKAGNSPVNNTAQVKKETLTTEQAQSLDSARSQLTSARMTLSRIQDSEISRSGAQACDAIEKVLQTLKEKPEKIQTTRQLFNYYLPTMDKVLSKYQRIEASDVENKDMPEKLNNYLTDVKEAMENLYEGLYDNDKLNVAVDIEAMTIAIKRDGLLDDEDFKNLNTDSDELEVNI